MKTGTTARRLRYDAGACHALQSATSRTKNDRPRQRWRDTTYQVGDFSMALFKLPLSGDVVQWINPVTWFASGNQISTNVYIGESSSPETEAEILDRVGTYGRQLGQITDAMIVLLRHLPDRESLMRKESDVIKAFEKMANDIADIKEKHKRQAVRPGTGA
jgi:hypothetical protein